MFPQEMASHSSKESSALESQLFWKAQLFRGGVRCELFAHDIRSRVAIMGPNGAGKSTVAGLAGGLVAIPVAILLSSVVLFDVVMQLLWWPFWYCIFWFRCFWAGGCCYCCGRWWSFSTNL